MTVFLICFLFPFSSSKNDLRIESNILKIGLVNDSKKFLIHDLGIELILETQLNWIKLESKKSMI